MQCDVCKVDTPYLHHLEHLATEVETSGRSSYSALMLGIYGLEVIHVVGSGRTAVNDISWQWSLAQSEELSLKLLMRAVVEESQCSSAACGVVNHLSHHWSVAIEEQFVAYTNLACRFHQYIPQTEFRIQFPQQEHLNLCVSFLLCTVESCRENSSVVEDECVALIEVFDGVTECHVHSITIRSFDFLAVVVSLIHLNLLTLTVEHHESALITAVNLVHRHVIICKCLVRRLKCHLIFRQIKSKF